MDFKFCSSWGRVSGVLISLLGHMGWGYVRKLEGVEGNCLAIPDLRWKMASRSISSMIYGMGLWPLKKPF